MISFLRTLLLFCFLLPQLCLAQNAANFPVTPPTQGAIQRVLCTIRSANMNTTTDQQCLIAPTITTWALTSILITNCSASLTTAAGGIYPTTAKGGTAIVAAVQAYTALSASTVVLSLTLAGTIATTRSTLSSVYLSLTLGQGSAATCDLYVIGIDLT